MRVLLLLPRFPSAARLLQCFAMLSRCSLYVLLRVSSVSYSFLTLQCSFGFVGGVFSLCSLGRVWASLSFWCICMFVVGCCYGLYMVVCVFVIVEFWMLPHVTELLDLFANTAHMIHLHVVHVMGCGFILLSVVTLHVCS